MPRRHQGSDVDAEQADADLRLVTERVAANVRERRRAAGLTQEQLAERVGCSPTYVQGIERAIENFTARMLGALARGVEVDVGDLMRAQSDVPADAARGTPLAANSSKRSRKPKSSRSRPT